MVGAPNRLSIDFRSYLCINLREEVEYLQKTHMAEIFRLHRTFMLGIVLLRRGGTELPTERKNCLQVTATIKNK